MFGPKNLKLVKLHGLNEKSSKIIKYYDNKLFLKEYDDYGRPLGITPDGRPGIFCVSKDLFWNGWFVLDEDVMFQKEYEIMKDMKND
jgi:hypothetical protein